MEAGRRANRSDRSTGARKKRASRQGSPFYKDDATGQLTTAPGIETDRELYKHLQHHEGEGMPAHPEGQPLGLMPSDEQRAERILKSFLIDDPW